MTSYVSRTRCNALAVRRRAGPIPARNMDPGLAAHRSRAAQHPGHGKRRRMPMPESTTPIVAGTRIGHVHLKVADLDRALGFYCDILGFELMQRLNSGAAFISAGGYQHHIGLYTSESKGGHPRPPGTE